jgi:hypothetical protein
MSHFSSESRKTFTKLSDDLGSMSFEFSMVSNQLDVLLLLFGAKLAKSPKKNLTVLTECSVKTTFLIEDKKFQKAARIVLKKSI